MGLIMKKSSCLLILAAAAMTSTAWGACSIPASPKKFPDGKTASLDQMKAARTEVGTFQEKMDKYQACIKDEYDALLKKYPKGDEELKKGFMESYKKKDDAAMDEKQKVVDKFNAERTAYQAAHPK